MIEAHEPVWALSGALIILLGILIVAEGPQETDFIGYLVAGAGGGILFKTIAEG